MQYCLSVGLGYHPRYHDPFSTSSTLFLVCCVWFLHNCLMMDFINFFRSSGKLSFKSCLINTAELRRYYYPTPALSWASGPLSSGMSVIPIGWRSKSNVLNTAVLRYSFQMHLCLPWFLRIHSIPGNSESSSLLWPGKQTFSSSPYSWDPQDQGKESQSFYQRYFRIFVRPFYFIHLE